MFDTLEFVKAAKENGFTEQQAEFQAKELSKWFNNELVTKSFLNTELKELEQRLLIKLGSIMIAGMTILGFILKH
jgi:hypothetical protein